MRILIVDDEDLLRDYLIQLDLWTRLGCEVVGEARNGEEALRVMSLCKPEMVITDIRMPIMDGITLAEKIRQLHPDLPIIFLSAYSDFTYTKQAIRLGVTDYITKPVDLEELFDVVNLVMQGERQVNRDERIQQEQTIAGMLSADLDLQVKEQLLKNENMTDIPLMVVCVEIDNVELLYAMGKPLSQLALREIVNHAIKFHPYKSWTFLDRRGLYLLLFRPMMGYWDMHSDSMKIAREILAACQKGLDFSISIGISSLLPSLLKLSTGWEEVKQCFEYRMLLGKQSIISYSALESGMAIEKNWDEVSLQKLTELLRKSDTEQIGTALRAIYREMLLKQLNKKFIQQFAIEIVSRSEALLAEYPRKMDEPNFHEIRKTVLSFDVLGDLMKYLESKLVQISKLIQSFNQDVLSVIIKSVKQYIETNYSDEITLTTLAESLHLNHSHLSRLIKKETGHNFRDLLWNHRILISKRKLLDPDIKTYEVAYDVGFKDPAHFSQLFKKIVGVSPGEYRKNQGG